MIFLFFKYLLYFQDGVLFLLFSLFIHLLEEYTQSLVGVLYKYIYFSLFIHLLEEYTQSLVGVLYKYIYISVCSSTSWRSTLSFWLESFINIYVYFSLFIHLLEEYSQSLVGVLYKYIYFSQGRAPPHIYLFKLQAHSHLSSIILKFTLFFSWFQFLCEIFTYTKTKIPLTWKIFTIS